MNNFYGEKRKIFELIVIGTTISRVLLMWQLIYSIYYYIALAKQ